MKEKVGLVLGGGGALGAYQVGAIEALLELGYHFDIITGTSIGALNGAFLAAGDFKAMKDLWRGITASKVYTGGMSFSLDEILYNKYDYSFQDFRKLASSYFKNNLAVDITPFRELLKSTLDLRKLKKSKVRLGIVTTRLAGLREVDVDISRTPAKKIIPYLHASSAIVPFFPPEVIDGKKYIDGFFSDNIPMRYAFELGADKLVVVDMRFFSPKAAQAAYLTYKNVEYIAPYRQLGSMIDFEQGTIEKNIRRGYLDVLKHFGKLKGFVFAFKGDLPSKGFFKAANEYFGKDALKVFEYLQRKSRVERPSDDDYFLRALDIVARGAGIDDDTTIYTFEKMRAEILKRIEYITGEKGRTRLGRSIFKKLFSDRANYFKSSIRRDIAAFFIEKYLVSTPKKTSKKAEKTERSEAN